MGRLLGYCRVSTADQNLSLQLDALERAGCVRVWSEHASGTVTARPELSELLAEIQPGDTLVVWKLDRLGRSLAHLVSILDDLSRRGIGFQSLTEAIDTTTATGRAFMQMMAVFAEFTASLARERTAAGLAAARSRGRVGGRPTVMTPDKLDAARRLMAVPGATIAATARALDVSESTIRRHLTNDAGRITQG